MQTLAGFVNNTLKEICVFREENHSVEKCLKGQELTFEEKKEILKEKKAYFKCEKIVEPRRRCEATLKCMFCERQHKKKMCRELKRDK